MMAIAIGRVSVVIIFVVLLSFNLGPSSSCLALSSTSTQRVSSSPSSLFLSWYDDASRRNGQLELSHRAYIDPLPDLGVVAKFDSNASGERQQQGPPNDTSSTVFSSLPTRLVRYAPLAFPHHLPTKNRAAKALKSGRLLLNSIPNIEGCRNLKPGDTLTLQTSAPTKLTDEELTKRMNFVRHMMNAGLSVQYEDEHLAAVYKPAGVHTKRDTTFRYLSLEDALPAILTPPLTEEAKVEALPLPLAVHRLDVRVCGLVLVAKTRRAMVDLGVQFERRAVRKRYEALVVGDPVASTNIDIGVDDTFVIDSPIRVNERGTLSARTAVTIVASVPHAHWGTLSHLELRPETGRTHQLRVHCADVGCPIVGDDLYWERGSDARTKMGIVAGDMGLPPVRKGGGLYLQSKGATFVHPVTGEKMDSEVPIADKFGRLLRKAREACKYDKQIRSSNSTPSSTEDDYGTGAAA